MESTTTQQQATTGTCARCGRRLTAARSVAANYGPTCARKVRAAARETALADLKPAQRAKAEELIESGGVVAIRGRRVFRVVASNGVDTYTTATNGQCTCPAYTKGRGRVTCYHVAAARALAA